MYRLLIVSRQQETKDFFSSYSEWSTFGFKPAHFRDSSDGAIDCMKVHAIDAVCIEPDPCLTDFMDCMKNVHPDLPMFSVAKTKSELNDILHELSRLLDRLNADDSNDKLDSAYMMQQQRSRWLRRLISGMETNPSLICRRMLLHRCAESPDTPCIVACLQMNPDDVFLNNRWHYGQDRLEMAMRNFFGTEHSGMRITVAVVSPEEIRIMFCSSDGKELPSEVTVARYVTETVEQIQNYLGLNLHLCQIRSFSKILEFSGIQE